MIILVGSFKHGIKCCSLLSNFLFVFISDDSFDEIKYPMDVGLVPKRKFP